ncbi:hypothetical protein ABPG74_007324 [Tetrahymena malaccensis]
MNNYQLKPIISQQPVEIENNLQQNANQDKAKETENQKNNEDGQQNQKKKRRKRQKHLVKLQDKRESQLQYLQKNSELNVQDQEDLNTEKGMNLITDIDLLHNQEKQKIGGQLSINQDEKINEKKEQQLTCSVQSTNSQISVNTSNVFKETRKLDKILQSSLFMKILIFHPFTNIFYGYCVEESRPFRFTIFYLRVIHSLSISTIFDEQYNELQVLVIALINSGIIVVSVAIISFIYKLRSIGKIIACTILLSLLVLYYYVILSIISGQSQYYSNVKISHFFIMFGIDIFFTSVILCLFNILMVIQIAKGAIQNKLILKVLGWLSIFEIVENLEL